MVWPDPAGEIEETPAEPETKPEETTDEAEQPAESESVTPEAPETPAKVSEKDDNKDEKKTVTYEEKTPARTVTEAVTKSVSNVIKIINDVKNKTLKVTLDNVSIDASDKGDAAVSVSGEGDTAIELEGDNVLKSGSNHAGLEHNKTETSGNLTIQDEDDDGSLDATGGFGGAGIGGGGVHGVGTVRISDNAEIDSVIGGDGAAAIGGGLMGSGNVTIRAGRFTASLHASLSTLRELRAEGVETITFQTILRSTTLSVDELLAEGSDEAELILTHRLTSSSLTIG